MGRREDTAPLFSPYAVGRWGRRAEKTWPSGRDSRKGDEEERVFFIFSMPASAHFPFRRRGSETKVQGHKRGGGEKKKKALFHVLRVWESVVRLVSVSRSIRKPPLFPTQRERTGVDKWDRDCSIAASRKVFGLTTTTAHPLLTNKCTNVRGLFSRKGKKMAEKGCLNSVFSDTAAPLGTTK